MKSLLTTSVRFTLFASLAAAAKVSYEGAKAMRVAVGEDVTVVADLISTLSLPTWKGAPQGIPKPNSNVDLVVLADKIAAFEQLTAGMTLETMHEDLGLAIEEEGRMAEYTGMQLPKITSFIENDIDLGNSWKRQFHLVQLIPSVR
jgi:hypothetical protein